MVGRDGHATIFKPKPFIPKICGVYVFFMRYRFIAPSFLKSLKSLISREIDVLPTFFLRCLYMHQIFIVVDKIIRIFFEK